MGTLSPELAPSPPQQIKHCNIINSQNFTNFDMHCVDVAMQIHQSKPPGDALSPMQRLPRFNITPFPHSRITILLPSGDILIFLTGRGEIDRAINELYKRSEELDYDRDVRDSGRSRLSLSAVFFE
jgi:hypothetical protein